MRNIGLLSYYNLFISSKHERVVCKKRLLSCKNPTHQSAEGPFLKVDTGMGRIGFISNEELLSAVKWVRKSSLCSHGKGFFTHFATADQADDTYWQEQNQRFQTALACLPELPKGNVHAGNSATAFVACRSHKGTWFAMALRCMD